MSNSRYISVTGASDYDGKYLIRFGHNYTTLNCMAIKLINGPMPKMSYKLRIWLSWSRLRNTKRITLSGTTGSMVVYSNFSRAATDWSIIYLDKRKKQSLNVWVKFALIKDLWCMSSQSWLRLCFFGIFYELALNSYINNTARWSWQSQFWFKNGKTFLNYWAEKINWLLCVETADS